MRKRIIPTLYCLALLCAGCSSTQDLVEEVAYKYSYAMANYNIDEAEQFADHETKKTTITTGRGLLAMVDSNYIKSDTPAKIEIIKTELVNDTTAVVTYHKTTPIKDFTGTVEVRKQDGEWLVHSPTPVIKEELPEQVEKALAKPTKLQRPKSLKKDND